MFRLLCLALALGIAGCAQQGTLLAPTGSQPSLPNAGFLKDKPDQDVVANVHYTNDTSAASEFTVYWSYRTIPFIWHEETHYCVQPGGQFDTGVVYRHIREGPQIRFVASARRDCHTWNFHHDIELTFREMDFKHPEENLYVSYREPKKFELCAKGAGNKEVCLTESHGR